MRYCNISQEPELPAKELKNHCMGYSFVQRMVVDEKKEYTLSSFRSKKGVCYKKDSDHNPLILWLQILVSNRKTERREFFNFKNPDCQVKFNELTSLTEKLTNCFKNDLKFPHQCQRS